jgi:hypothetical protein
MDPTATCHCRAPADTRCVVYKSGAEKFMCFDCAWRWLQSTNCCRQCGSVAHYRGNDLHPGDIDHGLDRCECKPVKKKYPLRDRGIGPIGPV